MEVVLPADSAPGSAGEREMTIYDLLEPLIGAVEGLPKDLAENHDHYLHGQPKR